MNIESSSLADFVELLRLEMEIHRKLISLLEDQRQALCRAQLTELKEINKRTETVVVELRILEEARKGMVERFAGELELSGSELTLTKLSEVVDERFSADLISCHTVLSALLDRLDKLLNGNADLIEHSFKMNNSLFSFLGSCMVGSQTYDSSGGFDDGLRKRSFFAQKA